MTKIKLTADAILGALVKSNAKTFSALHRVLGGKSNLASSTIKTFKALVPDIETRLKANRVHGATFQTSGKSKGRKRWPRHPVNPFRPNPNGGYSLVFDILAAHPNGIARDRLQELYHKTGRGISADKARFDVAVVLSVKGEGPDSERHKSCRSGFGLLREGNWVKLVLPK